MYYVCVENGLVTSVLPYEPTVPTGVGVHSVSDQNYQNIIAGTHFFNTNINSVEEKPQEYFDKLNQEQKNIELTMFLASTDWKVLRHLREQTLGQPTTLSTDEYLALEESRQTAAKQIVK